MSTILLFLALTAGQFGQSNTGELRFIVTDTGGLPLETAVELVSDANQLHQTLQTDQEGVAIAKRLPFGIYRVVVTRDGFGPFAGLVDVRSALPADYHVTLGIAPLQTQVTVRPEDTLVDPHRTTTVQRIGMETLLHRATSLPGRSLADLVNSQPGWLLEANGVLHPRGSEYQTQYVIDGLPLTDNRSPAFAPEIDADDVHAMSVLTGGYPAEYGRKLGGVVEVVTGGDTRRGLHGNVAASLGSFGTTAGNAIAQYAGQRTTVSASAGVTDTDRYLDPPVEENYTNRGTVSHAAVRLEHDVTNTDRFGAIVRYGGGRFLVPNELIQQDAGQRQDRLSEETVGQFSYQHIFSPHILADVRGMARTFSAGLWSNDAAIPISATQDRGFRELYAKGAVSAHVGGHEWKFGGEMNAGTVRERFGYTITDPTEFDPDTPATFDFDDRRRDREHALFVQDQMQFGNWTVNAGLRWDRYQLVVDEHSFSPRLGIAWFWPAADVALRASYDRAFQTPAVENLLLASSPALEALSEHVVRLPVRPSRGHFYEAGVSKGLFRRARLDASFFERTMLDAADDDLLLNTGVSFPIAFRRADIHGVEIKLDLPRWNALSGSVSYGYMRGSGVLPITGGLFLGDEATALIDSVERFPVSQDQRQTWRGRVTYQLPRSAWVTLASAYGSGLPFEFAGDRAAAIAQYGERIVDRVDFDTGRVGPSFSLDASAGFILVQRARQSLRLQVDVRNVTNRLTVINFAGLFSGTALAPPRSVAVRAQVDF
jgi:outer membrane cobalamin receptor